MAQHPCTSDADNTSSSVSNTRLSRRSYVRSIATAAAAVVTAGTAGTAAADEGDDSSAKGVVVTSDGSGVKAETPDGTAYSADDVGEIINTVMSDGFRDIHVQDGTYALNTRITAQDGMSLQGHDRPTFEITWGNTAVTHQGTAFDIAVYTNPTTSDVSIDGIVFDAVKEPIHASESQIIGDPRNVTTKYNWSITNCDFNHIPKYAINIDNHENVLIDGCRFYNGSHWWDGIPLRLHTTKSARVIDCYFDRNENGSSFPALRLDGWESEVDKCRFYDIYAAGIDVVDDYVNHGISFQVSQCQFSSNGSADGISIDHAGAADNVINDNVFYSLEHGVREVNGGKTRVVDNSFTKVSGNSLLDSSLSMSENIT